MATPPATLSTGDVDLDVSLARSQANLRHLGRGIWVCVLAGATELGAAAFLATTTHPPNASAWLLIGSIGTAGAITLFPLLSWMIPGLQLTPWQWKWSRQDAKRIFGNATGMTIVYGNGRRESFSFTDPELEFRFGCRGDLVLPLNGSSPATKAALPFPWGRTKSSVWSDSPFLRVKWKDGSASTVLLTREAFASLADVGLRSGADTHLRERRLTEEAPIAWVDLYVGWAAKRARAAEASARVDWTTVDPTAP